MGMKPHLYWEYFVCPNYSDFKDSPGNIRLAFNASVTCYHLIDHIHAFGVKNFPTSFASANKLEKYRDIIFEKCPNFKSVYSVSLAYKHLYVKNASSDQCSPASLHKVEISEGDSEVLRSIWLASGPKLFLRRKGKTELNFEAALDDVMEMWRVELDSRYEAWQQERKDALDILYAD